MTAALMATGQPGMPILTMQQAVERFMVMGQFVSTIMKRDIDYGVVPGTGTKAVLLKPGAEKLTTFFGLNPAFVLIERVEDWTGKDYDGEPLFYYLYKCQLWRNGEMIAEGDGSCSSRESKYRYRKAERVCPNCGASAIIKGKREYGGGWLCYAKKGGCGAKFRDGDPAVEGQETGRVANPDIADQANTILKMAQKRALIAAVLIGVNASEYFTQDLEDLPGYDIEAEARVINQQPQASSPTVERTQPAGAIDSDEEAYSVPQPANGGNGRKLPAIKTPLWAQLGAELVQQTPHYADNSGKFSGYHALQAVAQAGRWDVIDDSNVMEVMDYLRSRAAEKEVEP